jgi:uncharacterized protein with HEPN domain
MKDRLGDRTRLLHIRDSISEIESYISNKTLENLDSDSMLTNAVIRQLEVIGEAVNKLSDSLKNDYPEVDWKSIIVMRNILIHEYFSVSVKILWSTIIVDLPHFKNTINKIIETK